MYYPIQMPTKLDKNYFKYKTYNEEIIEGYSNYIICLWEILPNTETDIDIHNIILMDGCIDLVVDFTNKHIGFSGMKKTNFDFVSNSLNASFGLRLMPGVFHSLTGLDASKAMDTFLLLEEVFEDFNASQLWKLEYIDAREFVLDFIKNKLNDIVVDDYIKLFPTLTNNLNISLEEIYAMFNLSPRQCQRMFMKHFGISPKQVLSVIRFQHCLKVLTSSSSSPNDILDIYYYDQAHFINDFKKNIGITPFEFMDI